MTAVKIDPANPGQYFACCGLLELAHRLFPDVEGWFNGDTFRISPLQDADVQPLLECLTNSATVVDTSRGEKKAHPVRIEDFSLTLDWWVGVRGKANRLKLWAGPQTSLSIVEDLIEAIRGAPFATTQEVFDFHKPLSGRLGVDPRSSWNTRDVGYSPNEQGMEVTTYPVVELLAAIGLQGFRPCGQFSYSTWDVRLPVIVARAAASGTLFPGDLYTCRIVQRGSYKAFTFATTNNHLK